LAKAKTKKKATSKKRAPRVTKQHKLAIAGLIVNLFIPGLGSIIGKKKREGIVQLIIFIVGVILSPILIGIPVVIAMWIWALVTSIQMVIEAE
jgi:TM2 domain-containing membrane protein YozV